MKPCRLEIICLHNSQVSRLVGDVIHQRWQMYLKLVLKLTAFCQSCLLHWNAASGQEEVVCCSSANSSPLGCLCSFCSDGHLFTNTLQLMHSAAEGSRRPLPLSCVIRHKEAAGANTGSDNSRAEANIIRLRPGTINEVRSTIFWCLLHLGMLVSVRWAPASGKRSTSGLLFRKTAPTQNIIGSAYLVVSCRRRGEATSAQLTGCAIAVGLSGVDEDMMAAAI